MQRTYSVRNQYQRQQTVIFMTKDVYFNFTTQAIELHVIDYYVCKYIQNIIVKQASFETDSIETAVLYTLEQIQVHYPNIHIIHTKYICMFSISLKMEINYNTRS